MLGGWRSERGGVIGGLVFSWGGVFLGGIGVFSGAGCGEV